MWEFLGRVMEQYGIPAVIVIATYVGLGVAIRELWRKSHDQQEKAAAREALLTKEALAREALLLKEEHAKRSLMREEHDNEVRALVAQAREDARRYADHLDKLHEKRNDEMREMLRESVTHMAETRGAVEKITGVMQTLQTVLSRR